jgi:hypothetical protein
MWTHVFAMFTTAYDGIHRLEQCASRDASQYVQQYSASQHVDNIWTAGTGTLDL